MGLILFLKQSATSSGALAHTSGHFLKQPRPWCLLSVRTQSEIILVGRPRWVPSPHYSYSDRDRSEGQGSHLSHFFQLPLISQEPHPKEWPCLGPSGPDGLSWQREPHVEQVWLTPPAGVCSPGWVQRRTRSLVCSDALEACKDIGFYPGSD